jgi:hypothetical protein
LPPQSLWMAERKLVVARAVGLRLPARVSSASG